MKRNILQKLWYRLDYGIPVGGFFLSRDIPWVVRQLWHRFRWKCWPGEVWGLHNAAEIWMIPRLQKYYWNMKHDKHHGIWGCFVKFPWEDGYVEVSDNEETNRARRNMEIIVAKIIFALKAEDDPNYGRKFKASDLNFSFIQHDNVSKELSIRHKINDEAYSIQERVMQNKIEEGYNLLGKYWRYLWD